jgi:hypothetical protein
VGRSQDASCHRKTESREEGETSTPESLSSLVAYCEGAKVAGVEEINLRE